MLNFELRNINFKHVDRMKWVRIKRSDELSCDSYGIINF
jgi:hypothetical protein